jgi:hypothetical protein
VAWKVGNAPRGIPVTALASLAVVRNRFEEKAFFTFADVEIREPKIKEKPDVKRQSSQGNSSHAATECVSGRCRFVL